MKFSSPKPYPFLLKPPFEQIYDPDLQYLLIVVPIWLVLTSESATEEGEVIRMVINTDNRNLSCLPCRDREVAIDNVNECC